MIERIEISGVHFEVDDDVRKYVIRKIGRLDRFMQAHARKSAHVTVQLKEEKSRQKNRFTAEVIMHIPRGNIMVKETTLNIYAAIDIVEAKLRNQLQRAKEKAVGHHERRPRMLSKLFKLARRSEAEVN